MQKLRSAYTIGPADSHCICIRSTLLNVTEVARQMYIHTYIRRWKTPELKSSLDMQKCVHIIGYAYRLS